jgi:DNA repair exonuclease SbcCD nuclease subunit
MSLQKPDKKVGYIDIAVAHGSEADDTLHKSIKFDDYQYDYIALGHEHGLIPKSNNRYYAGCLLPMNFKELFEKQGYLIVDIDEKTRGLNIKEISTTQLISRPFEMVDIEVTPKDSSEELRGAITRELNKYTDSEGFNPKTSARLKFNFVGEMTFEKVWQINDLMIKLRRKCFSEEETYNIFQLIWQTVDISEYSENDVSPGIIEDYILDNPEQEFKGFVNEKLSNEKTKFDVEKLTFFGMGAIKSALKILDKEEEV